VNIYKSPKKSERMFHFVCQAEYRRAVFSKEVDTALKDICLEMSKQYEIEFLEIGTDKNNVHFLVQTASSDIPMMIMQTIKSLTTREIFARHPEVKKKLWNGQFWSGKYSFNTVSKLDSDTTIRNYMKNQGTEQEYEKLHEKVDGGQLCISE
jgi:putative transposase